MQYDLLNDDVKNIISISQSSYDAIDALGMAEVAFYSNATQQGVMKSVENQLAPSSNIAIINTKTHEVAFLAGENSGELVISSDLIQAMLSKEAGQGEYQGTSVLGENINAMAVFDIYPNWDWLIVSYVNKNQLFKYAYDAMALSLVIAVACFILLLLAVYKLSHSVSRSIEVLEGGSRQLANNDLDVNLEIKGNNEFSRLANSFNVMAKEISNTQYQLERSIAEQKIANLSLIETREQYRDLVESTSDIITRVDLNGRFLFVNNAAANILGLPVADCINRFAFDFVHIDDKAATQQTFDYWVQTGDTSLVFENRQVSVEGAIHHMIWSVRAEYDDNGVIDGFASFAKDTTELKRTEEARDELEKQLFQTQKMEAVGQLAGGIAHDFNNMLCVIIGHADLAVQRLDSRNPVISNLYGIQKAAHHSADLTRQLLTFARKQAIDPKVLNLNESVMAMLGMLRRLIGENIKLSYEAEGKLWPVKVDPSQVDQILANLCVNARDAIDGIGHITITIGNHHVNKSMGHGQSSMSQSTIEPGDYVKVSVADDGSGIDDVVVARIFEPFFTTKKIGEGTGLGLATVFGAVQQNKGFIEVLSELKQGTRFNVYFPRAAEPVPEVMAAVSKLCVQGSETVLLVEDEMDLLEIETAMLEQHGYNVLAAKNATVAEAFAKNHVGKIDLLLTDVIMPEMNGGDLSVKLLGLLPNMKVLFMSGYTADVIATQGVLQENVKFLQKPFTIEKLTSKVREVLDA